MALYFWEATCLLISNATEFHRLAAASMHAKKGGILEEKVSRKTAREYSPSRDKSSQQMAQQLEGKEQSSHGLCPVLCSDEHSRIQLLASLKDSSTQNPGRHQSFLLFFYKHPWHLEIGGF